MLCDGRRVFNLRYSRLVFCHKSLNTLLTENDSLPALRRLVTCTEVCHCHQTWIREQFYDATTANTPSITSRLMDFNNLTRLLLKDTY